MLKLVITCEHGGNKIPKEYEHLFNDHKEMLNTHRAWDPGALLIYNNFINKNEYFHLHSDISRLLIELNRSLHHSKLFSEFTNDLDIISKNKIIADYYSPFRSKVYNEIESLIKSDFQVLHLSLHTFTPVLNGVKRNTDIGFLYDPKSSGEKFFAKLWKNELVLHSSLKVRFNYPYLGISDGHTSFLRKKFGYNNYFGIELEVNQNLYYTKSSNFNSVIDEITSSFWTSFSQFKN